MITLIREFGALSINNTKSSIMRLGSTDGDSSHIGNIKISPTYNTFGVWFAYNADSNFHYEHNFRPILRKMQACCDSWTNRSLSIKGKVTVLNVLVSSLLQYMCSILYTPSRVFEEVKTLTSAFLWGKGRSKVAYTTLVQSVQDGGLRLANLETRTKVNHSRWVARLIWEPQSCPAKFLQFLTNSHNLSNFLMGKWKP